MVLSNWKFGNFFSVNFGWGVGVTLGCYWGGGVSGQRPTFCTSYIMLFATSRHTFNVYKHIFLERLLNVHRDVIYLVYIHFHIYINIYFKV